MKNVDYSLLNLYLQLYIYVDPGKSNSTLKCRIVLAVGFTLLTHINFYVGLNMYLSEL